MHESGIIWMSSCTFYGDTPLRDLKCAYKIITKVQSQHIHEALAINIVQTKSWITNGHKGFGYDFCDLVQTEHR